VGTLKASRWWLAIHLRPFRHIDRAENLAALMLGYLHGDAMDMTQAVDTFGIKLTKVDEYARRVMGKTASA
jgi:hypothetical protein